MNKLRRIGLRKIVRFSRFISLKVAAGPVILMLFGIVMMYIPAEAVDNNHYNEVITVQDSQDQPQPHIVFLISEDPNNYEAPRTIPPFADRLQRENGFQTTVIKAEGDLPALRFPDLLDVLSEADLLVIFFRRTALPSKQLDAIKSYLNEDEKPLVGIRTANHSLSVLDGEIPDGYEDWWDFVPDILGSKNRGYGPTELGTKVALVPEQKDHFILQDFEPAQWHSTGNVYHTAPLLDDEATVLLTGEVEGKVEPIAWTRTAGESRVFYTSLGHPADFGVSQFRTLLINGIRWALALDC